jgi:hypothetical protein
MSNYQTDVPLINVPLVRPNGMISEAWFMFLIQLFRRTGGGTGGDGQLTIADVLSYDVTMAQPAVNGAVDTLGLEAIQSAVAQSIGSDVMALEVSMAWPSDAGQLTEMNLAPISDSMGQQAPKSITLGASPATYTATYRQALHITGGTVSAISLARSGTSLALATGTGLIELSAGDQVTVTYTALPTTTILGR